MRRQIWPSCMNGRAGGGFAEEYGGISQINDDQIHFSNVPLTQRVMECMHGKNLPPIVRVLKTLNDARKCVARILSCADQIGLWRSCKSNKISAKTDGTLYRDCTVITKQCLTY